MLALAVLVGLVGGVVLAAAAGARRTATAFDRFLEATDAAHVAVRVEGDPRLLVQVEQLPQVAAAAPLSYLLVRPAGTDLEPALEFTALAGVDGRLGTVVDRPWVIRGRAPDPGRIDEIAINEAVAADLDLAVGDQLELEWLARDQLERLFTGEDFGPLAGPTEPLTVVAVTRSPTDLMEVDLFASPVTVTPAFYRSYGPRMAAYDGITAVRLHHAEADVGAFTAAVNELSGGGPNVNVTPTSETVAKVDNALGVLALSLALFALTCALAGMAAIALVIGRQVAATAEEQPILAALGLGRVQRTAALVVATLPAALAGAGTAVVVAVAASPLLPLGLARRAEPDPGLAVDAVVLGAGAVAVMVVVVGLSTAIAWWTVRPGSRARRAVPDAATPSLLSVSGLLARAGLPPAAAIGARRALPGAGNMNPRAVLVGAVSGVAGLVAAATFGASLLGLVDAPGRYGWNWDLSVPGVSSEPEQGPALELVSDPDVADLATMHLSLAVVEGETTPVFGLEPLKGSMSYTIIDGRGPDSADEVVLGTTTLHHLGRRVGDTVTSLGVDGARRLRIVGRAAFPSSDQDSLADGAGLTAAGYDGLETSQDFTDLVLRWAPGTDGNAAQRRLEEQLGRGTFTVVQPAEVQNLEQVAWVPPTLGAFLGLLAVLATSHALAAGGGRRRREVAVLKAVGFVRRQVRAIVGWHAGTLAAVGLAGGIPVGIALGRGAWALVAQRIGVEVAPAVPVGQLVAAVPIALLAANALAVLPAVAAARIRPAVALRAE
jgi:hypothetical protein